MQKKDRLNLEAIIQGSLLEAKRGWRETIKENSSACKIGIRLDLIRIKDLHKGNKQYVPKQLYHSEWD